MQVRQKNPGTDSLKNIKLFQYNLKLVFLHVLLKFTSNKADSTEFNNSLIQI